VPLGCRATNAQVPGKVGWMPRDHDWNCLGARFARESEMTSLVVDWLRASGLEVRSEFVSPWGECDLVGARLSPTRVAERLRLGQSRAVGSITRAALLLDIPELGARRGTTVAHLVDIYASSVTEPVVREEIGRLIADGFVVTSSRGRLARVNGWFPLHERLVAVELKLSRVDDAIRQARSNLGFADESYIALPIARAHRVAAAPRRRAEIARMGIGVIGVTREGCELVMSATPRKARTDKAIQLYCIEKFWRQRLRPAATQRQFNISGSTTASGRRAVPSSSSSGSPRPSAKAEERSWKRAIDRPGAGCAAIESNQRL